MSTHDHAGHQHTTMPMTRLIRAAQERALATISMEMRWRAPDRQSIITPDA